MPVSDKEFSSTMLASLRGPLGIRVAGTLSCVGVVVAGLAKRCSVGYVVSEFRISCPSFDVMHLKSLRSSALLAPVSVSGKASQHKSLVFVRSVLLFPLCAASVNVVRVSRANKMRIARRPTSSDPRAVANSGFVRLGEFPSFHRAADRGRGLCARFSGHQVTRLPDILHSVSAAFSSFRSRGRVLPEVVVSRPAFMATKRRGPTGWAIKRLSA